MVAWRGRKAEAWRFGWEEVRVWVVAAMLFFHQEGEPRCSFWKASPINC